MISALRWQSATVWKEDEKRRKIYAEQQAKLKAEAREAKRQQETERVMSAGRQSMPEATSAAVTAAAGHSGNGNRGRSGACAGLPGICNKVPDGAVKEVLK